MASKGRVPPPLHRRPLPGPGVVHPDAYASAVHRPVGGFPHFEMLPPHEVMAHKLSAQNMEIEKLATENQRLATTHVTLRQDLAAAKHELQLVHAHIAGVNSEKEQQIRGITEKMSKMESELEAAESIKKELQQARTEAQSLVSSRQELISKAQQLDRELRMAHSEAQQIPPLMAELDSLRQEYQHCRSTYDYEKKLYNDHLESLQVIEKNYMSMSREVEKLRTELSNSTNYDHRTGGQLGTVPLSNYASGQAYGVQPGHGSHLGGATGVGPTVPLANSPHVVAQPAPYGSGAARDASRGPFYSYDAQKVHGGSGYEGQRVQTGAIYDPQRGLTGAGYDAQRGPAAPAHNAPRIPGYEAQRGHRPEAQKAHGDEVQRGANYGASSRGTTAGPQGQVSMNNLAYPPTPNTRAGTGYESAARGANPVHR